MHYPWVNVNKNGDKDTECTAAENHAKELFMCGQHDMIAIGGGSVSFSGNLIDNKNTTIIIRP